MSHHPTELMVLDPMPLPATSSRIVKGDGDDPVVMFTGYAKLTGRVGGTQVAPVVQAKAGAVPLVIDVTLPLVENIPTSASVADPELNVVAAVVTCQPAPVPVASSTT